MSVVARILERHLRALTPLQATVLRPICLALLGPLCRPGRAAGAERGAPQALAGLGRRGSVERLSHGEWALHDEIPEEFLRRWGADELLYLRLLEEAPRAPGPVEVWIDQGPATLGGARVGLAAALLTLAAEAEATGAAFAWGSLQGGRLRVGLSCGWLTELLEERSLRAAPHEAGGSVRGHPSVERVWLGAPLAPGVGVASGARRVGATCLTVGDGRGPDAALRLEISNGQRGKITVTVTLSSDTAPFLRGHAKGPSAAGPARDTRWKMTVLPLFFFSPSGARLLLVAREGATAQEAVALPVGEEPGDARRVHRRSVEGEVRALGWLRQRLVVLVEGEDGMQHLDDGGKLRLGLDHRAPRRSPVEALHRAPGEGGVFCSPPPGELRDLTRPVMPTYTLAIGGRPAVEVDPGEVLTATADGRRITLRAQGDRLSLGLPGLSPSLRPAALSPSGEPRPILFCWHGSGEEGLRGRYAVGPGRGAVSSGNLPWPAGPGVPRGLVRMEGEPPRVLVDGPDGLVLWGEGRAPMQLSHRAVQSCAVSPRGDCVAWLEADGELILYHVPEQRIIGRTERA